MTEAHHSSDNPFDSPIHSPLFSPGSSSSFSTPLSSPEPQQQLPNGFHAHRQRQQLTDSLPHKTAEAEQMPDSPAQTAAADSSERELEDDAAAAAEPPLLLEFTLSSAPDASSSVVSSLSSLSASLADIRAAFHTVHRHQQTVQQQQLAVYEQQHSELTQSISSLHSALSALSSNRAEKLSSLSSLKDSVASSLTTQEELSNAITASSSRVRLLHEKGQRRGRVRARPARLMIFSFIVGRDVRIPLVAVSRIFSFLPVRDVESCCRACKLWQQLIDRSRAWPLTLRRLAANKRKKERELEETGEATTRDEFDDVSSQQLQDGSQGHGLSSPSSSAHHAFDTSPPSPAAAAAADPFTLTPQQAAKLNLPPHDLPVPSHLHYALTIDLQRDAYSVNIASRRVSTLYQCASLMDTLTPAVAGAAAAPPLPKTSSVVICCPLVPKSTNAAELSFCESVMGMEEQLQVAKGDVLRLGRQLEEDVEVKRRLQAELERREEAVRRVQSELDMMQQQSMSDEMTRQFLEDSVRDVQQQMEEEMQQTQRLRAMLRDAYRKREEELDRMERESEELEAQVQELQREKRTLTKEVKTLQVELEAVAAEKERAKREYEKLTELVDQLRAL